MGIIEYNGVALFGSIIASFLGAMTGIGGGVLIVPLLTIVCGVEIHYAVGASLVSVIATSSSAAAAYVRDGLVNIRLALFLGIATTLGALVGALIAVDTPTRMISLIFGLFILLSELITRFKKFHESQRASPSVFAARLKLNSAFVSKKGLVTYSVTRVTQGFSMMFTAGIISGLLGIGSGVVKVLALEKVMQIPFRVSTATSNFLIGLTASASLGLYLKRGLINPVITLPVILGSLIGAYFGAKVAPHIKSVIIKNIFTAFLVIIGIQMVYRGLF